MTMTRFVPQEREFKPDPDLRGPLPKPMTPEQLAAFRKRDVTCTEVTDPVHKLAHDCGIPVAGARMLVVMLADMQHQIDALKAEVKALEK